MPVEVRWYVQNHVLLARYYGNVTPDDIVNQYTVGFEMCESVDTVLVHLIADISEVQSFPKTVMDYKGRFGEKAKNAGWVILVGENRMIRFLSTVVTNLMKLRFSYVNTLGEALEFISARDPFLNLEEFLDMTIPYEKTDDAG